MMKLISLLATTLLCTQLSAQKTWTLSNNGISSQITITAFAAAPNGDLYAAGKGVNTSLQWYPLLYRSTNNGLSWTNLGISTGLSVRQPAALVFAGNTLLMAGRGSSSTNYVLASTDFGATWTSASTGINQQYRPKDFASTPGGVVYLLTAQGNYNGLSRIYWSSNAGGSWTEINIVDLNPFIEPSSILFDQNSKLYLAALDNINYMTRNLLYTSLNFGQNWLPSYSGIPAAATVNDMVRGKGSEIYGVCTETVGTASTFTCRIIKSTNFGGSWITVPGVSGLTGLKESRCAFVHNGYMLLAGGGDSYPGYVFRSLLVSAPTVSTTAAFDIMDVTATAGGLLTDTGGVLISQRGVCWSTNPAPTLAQNSAQGNAATNYTVSLSGLQPATKYYVRAFASNSIGSSYGNEVSFTTQDFTSIGESNSSQNRIQIYPSPAGNILYVRSSENTGDQHICLFDVLGVKQLEVQITKGLNAIDLSGLSQGCYFLYTDEGKCHKIIKQ